MNRFENQTAIVTGGTSGLGLAIARRLVTEGAFAVVWDMNAKACDELAKDLGSRGRCEVVDVTNEAQVRAAVGLVTANRGKIDILVNCAGVTGKTNIKSHEVTLEDFDFVMRVNLDGSFLTAKHVLPGMVNAGYGRILHIASIAGKEGNAGMLAYSASKAAVVGMPKSRARNTPRPASPSTPSPLLSSRPPW